MFGIDDLALFVRVSPCALSRSGPPREASPGGHQAGKPQVWSSDPKGLAASLKISLKMLPILLTGLSLKIQSSDLKHTENHGLEHICRV